MTDAASVPLAAARASERWPTCALRRARVRARGPRASGTAPTTRSTTRPRWCSTRSASITIAPAHAYGLRARCGGRAASARLRSPSASERRVPAAYLIGRMWFAGLEFEVDERVIVPRSPFAELIDARFRAVGRSGACGSILDIGTGSRLHRDRLRAGVPAARVDAVDVSSRGARGRRRNVARHGVSDRVRLLRAMSSSPSARGVTTSSCRIRPTSATTRWRTCRRSTGTSRSSRCGPGTTASTSCGASSQAPRRTSRGRCALRRSRRQRRAAAQALPAPAVHVARVRARRRRRVRAHAGRARGSRHAALRRRLQVPDVGQHVRPAVHGDDLRREPRAGARLHRRRLPAGTARSPRRTSSATSSGAVRARRGTRASVASPTGCGSCPASSKAGRPVRRSACWSRTRTSARYDYEKIKDRFRPGPCRLHLPAEVRVSRLPRRRTLLGARDGDARRGRRDRPQVPARAGRRPDPRLSGADGDDPIEPRRPGRARIDNPFFCPDPGRGPELEAFIDQLRRERRLDRRARHGVADGVPPGLGEPVFDRLDADLAHAMMGINAVKGVEIGAGFAAVDAARVRASRRTHAATAS